MFRIIFTFMQTNIYMHTIRTYI